MPYTPPVAPSRSETGTAMGVGQALSLTAVYRAIQIITTAVKQLGIDAYRGNDVIDPAPGIVRQPNVNETSSRFCEETTQSLAASGNAYWLIDRDAQSRVSNLTVLNPLDVTIKETDWGTVTSYDYKGLSFTPDRVKHLKLMSQLGRVTGLGPIQAAQSDLYGAAKVSAFAGSWFDTSGTPAGGYLSTDQTVNAENAKVYRDAWTASTGNRSGVPVLGNGFTFQQSLLSPKDALWIEAQQFNTTLIARLFGIPANLLLAAIEGGSDTYANLETEFTTFARFTLMNYLTEIENALSDLLPRGTVAKFNLDSLLRPDTKTRYEAHQIALNAGFLTKDEVRAIENLPPLTASQKEELKPTPPPVQLAPQPDASAPAPIEGAAA